MFWLACCARPESLERLRRTLSHRRGAVALHPGQVEAQRRQHAADFVVDFARDGAPLLFDDGLQVRRQFAQLLLGHPKRLLGGDAVAPRLGGPQRVGQRGTEPGQPALVQEVVARVRIASTATSSSMVPDTIRNGSTLPLSRRVWNASRLEKRGS